MMVVHGCRGRLGTPADKEEMLSNWENTQVCKNM